MERLLTLYSEVQSTDVRWLWYPFIAIGKITLLQGDPGDGKSTMMMNLIAELSTGGKTPDGCKIGTPQKVIYGKHLVELKRELNKEVGYKGVQLVTISRPTAYGEYAPYHFVDTEQEFQTLVKGLRP